MDKKNKFTNFKKKLKKINLKFLSFIKNNKNTVLITIILIVILSISIYISYSYFSYTTKRSLIEGTVDSFVAPHLNIKYMVENRDDAGIGNDTYTAYWNAPVKDYVYIPEKSFCTNDATFTRNEDDTFDVVTSGKTRCEFFYDAVDLTSDSDVKINVLMEKGTTCSTGICEYVDASDYTIQGLINDGYEFIQDKSSCEGTSTITYDETLKKLVTDSKEKTVCRAYFEIAPPSMSDILIESGLASGELVQHTPEITTSAGDNNYRYSGANPNNWVCFGSDETICPEDNLYRVLGIYNINGEQKVKLIKENELASQVFDAGDDNRWEGANTTDPSDDADINIYLNNTFYNTISSKYQSMISEEKYNIGGVPYDQTYKPKDFYEDEILTQTEQKYKIGLMQVSDYFYGASESYWGLFNYESESSTNDYYQNTEMQTNNWMFKGIFEWTMVPHSSYANYMWLLDSRGSTVSHNARSSSSAGRPVLYLKSNVSIIGGLGTEGEPYRLG